MILQSCLFTKLSSALAIPFPTPKPFSSFQLTISHLGEGEMSSRRSGGSRITEEEINELIGKLQSLLPESRRRNMGRASASKLLKETCNYIKGLHKEVDDLSERLSALMSTMDSDSPQAEIIRSLLR